MSRAERPRDPSAVRQGPSGAAPRPQTRRTTDAGSVLTRRPTPGGWAVVEIRPDGSWGTPVVVPAATPEQAVTTARTLLEEQRLRELSPLVHAQVGTEQVAEGNLPRAEASFVRGADRRTPWPARGECLGKLAHVLALEGNLRRAGALASLFPDSRSSSGRGIDHARAARAWVALERGDCALAQQHVDVLAGAEQLQEDPWLATSVLLARSQVLVRRGGADTASRLLAAAVTSHHEADWPDWTREVLTVGRAAALLAAGEVQRCLAVLTPMPVHARPAATVLVAVARHRVGDVRGASSVLRQVQDRLDCEPLVLQVRAWLLEAVLADERGEHERAALVLDRALRTAASEQVRLPLLDSWSWIRRTVDRDAALLHSHKEFLTTCAPEAPAIPRPRTAVAASDGPPPAPLTEREEEVLELLAQMYSTEEIADTLFISVNTVKTHLKGIFGKLCVNRRVDAVRRGRQLGLC